MLTNEDIQVHRYEDFVGIRICPKPIVTPKGFHIAFVLDTSGSMTGERLETVQRTLSLFFQELREGDKVTVISYNSVAHVLASAETSVAKLEAIAKGLKAGGGTNLEDAILKVAGLPTLSSVDAVFLLTDGEVNQGILSTAGLEALVRMTLYREDGSRAIPVYTVGYGADHNAQLLQGLALTTRSSYTYAESSELVPAVVGSLLVAMREEVAKVAEVHWDPVAEAEVTCWELGYDPETAKGKYCVGNVIAEKPQWVILKGTGVALDSLRITWKGGEQPLSLSACVREGQEVEVLEQALRAKAARVFADLSEVGIPAMMALAKLQGLEDEITAAPTSNTSPLLLRLRAELADRRAFYDAMGSVGHVGLIGDHREQMTRFASQATAFANQRGEGFASPTQRLASQQMVAAFSQQTQDPQ